MALVINARGDSLDQGGGDNTNGSRVNDFGRVGLGRGGGSESSDRNGGELHCELKIEVCYKY